MEGDSELQYHTHLAFAGMVGLGVMDIVQKGDTSLYLAGLAIGALLPDIDHPKSKISRKIPIAPVLISAIFTHRTFFHSLLFLGLLSLLYGVAPSPLVTGLLVGAASHILGDMLTVSGVKLFYPFGNYIRLPFTFRTGGIVEQLCFLVFSYITVTFYM